MYTLTSDILVRLKPILEEFKPDFVNVHGDTTTTMSIAAFYSGAKVCHVEAGLRTHNKYAPFREEMNRQVTGRNCNILFLLTMPMQETYAKHFLSINWYIKIPLNILRKVTFLLTIPSRLKMAEKQKQIDK